jgi:hypothetical protein
MVFPRRSLSRTAKNPPTARCCFSFSDGRYCRMPRAADHPEYCIHHSREDRQLLETERIGALLAATPSGEFLTATDVNSVLGKLYTAIALNRIPHRNAALMAYVGQLLLNSTQAIKSEIMNAQSYTSWCKISRNALTDPLPQPPPMKSALPIDLEPEHADEASDENDEEEEEIVEPQDNEGNFAQEAEEEYEVTAPAVFDPSSFNEEYDAKNNESRLLSDLKAATQVLHPKKL